MNRKAIEMSKHHIGEKICDVMWGGKVEVLEIIDHLEPTVYKVKDEDGNEYLLPEDDVDTLQ